MSALDRRNLRGSGLTSIGRFWLSKYHTILRARFRIGSMANMKISLWLYLEEYNLPILTADF